MFGNGNKRDRPLGEMCVFVCVWRKVLEHIRECRLQVFENCSKLNALHLARRCFAVRGEGTLDGFYSFLCPSQLGKVSRSYFFQPNTKTTYTHITLPLQPRACAKQQVTTRTVALVYLVTGCTPFRLRPLSVCRLLFPFSTAGLE